MCIKLLMCLREENSLVSQRSLCHQILEPHYIRAPLFLMKMYTRQTKGPQNAVFFDFPSFLFQRQQIPKLSCVVSKINSATLTADDWMGINPLTVVDHVWVGHTGGRRKRLERNSAWKASPYWMVAVWLIPSLFLGKQTSSVAPTEGGCFGGYKPLPFQFSKCRKHWVHSDYT